MLQGKVNPGAAQEISLFFCFAAILKLVFCGGRAWMRCCCMSQVFCDRHYGGINYPRGGVGRIAELLVEGLQERGSYMEYKANVSFPFSSTASTAVLARKPFFARQLTLRLKVASPAETTHAQKTCSALCQTAAHGCQAYIGSRYENQVCRGAYIGALRAEPERNSCR